MATKRKSISNKIRFEVFKRDSFKCQYCGKGAPDVVLQVDHIKPVSEGGDNSITNLVTSCFECNNGKSNILLDDNSIMEKQRKQLEELNERRNQLEMMLQWREGLSKIDDDKVSAVIGKWEGITKYQLTNSGINKVKKWVKKFEFTHLLDAVDDSTKYLVCGEDGYTKESVEKSFSYIPRICTNKLRDIEEPFLKDLYYIRGIMRNRFTYCNDQKALEYLRSAYELGASIQVLKDFVLGCKNWSDFRDGIEDYIESKSSGDEV